MNTSSLSSSADGVPNNNDPVLTLLWEAFTVAFPTEKDCVRELYRMINDENDCRCKFCGCEKIVETHKMRAGKCGQCYREFWYTADTFFDGIKKPIAWLGAFWLMQQGVSFSAGDLARLAKVSISTAWIILKKIKMVLQECWVVESKGIEISSTHFAPAICRRSLETPANRHPHAEQDEMEKRVMTNEGGVGSAEILLAGSSNNKKDQAVKELDESEKKVYEILSTGKLDLDGIFQQTHIPVGKLSSILTVLEVRGLIECLPGDLFKHNELSSTSNQASNIQFLNCADLSPSAIVSIADGVNFIRSNFHGISRKYLQLFLAAHWYYVDKDRWPGGTLLKTCSRFRAIKYRDILSFVSPLFVKVIHSGGET
jgi:hypothetical protein